MMRSLLRLIHFVEDSLLITLLFSMILLACSQILLRNFFDAGFTWADPLLRIMVLWTGLIGATVASRDNRHIRIDLLGRHLPKYINLLLQVLVGLFTAFVCLVIGWYAAQWVWMDYQDPITSFAGIPGWWFEVVIPAAFVLISIRYLIHVLIWLRMFFETDKGTQS